MRPTSSLRSLARRAACTFALAACLLAPALHAEVFQSTPARSIGPFASGQAAPQPPGGWQAGDDRSVGASIAGQGGWGMGCNAARYDQEITPTLARTGLQSWRVSNWFHEGCINTVLSPAFSSVQEGVGPSSQVTAQFWFRVPSGNDGLVVSNSLTDVAGSRLTYAAVRDIGGSLRVEAVGILLGSGGSNPLPAPFNDPGVDYEVVESPALAHDTWYQLRVHAALVAGSRNDSITYSVLDADGGTVWSSTIGSWEDAYLDGPFAAPGTKVVVTRLGFRLAENPDNPLDRTPHGSYALNRPAGVFIDDLQVTPGSGSGIAAGFEADRFVAPGGADSGSCGNPLAPCASLAYALAQATPNNRVSVASGTYQIDTPPHLTQPGVHIVGRAFAGHPYTTQPVLTRSTGAPDRPLLTLGVPQNPSTPQVDHVNGVRIENLHFDVDQTVTAEGLVAHGIVDGLHIVGNRFSTRRSGAAGLFPAQASFGRRNAIAINLVNRQNGSAVLVEHNRIEGDDSGGDLRLFRAGVAMDAGVGTIRNNVIASQSHGVIARFATVTADTGGGIDSVRIEGNDMYFGGVTVSGPNASAHGIVVHDNDLVAPAAAAAFPDSADFGLVRLVANHANVPLTFSNNRLSGYADHFRGLLIQNFPNVTLTGNAFTPAPNAVDFTSLAIANKEASTDNPPAAAYPMAIVARDNDFFASAGAPDKGTAVMLINDNDGGGMPTGSLVFGGAGAQANRFDADLRWYFYLRAESCSTRTSALPPTAAGAGPLCTFLGYNTVGNVPNTEVRPFAQGFSAEHNLFGGAAPSAANALALAAATFDKDANPALGQVDYGTLGQQDEVYVDNDFSSYGYGEPVAFTHDAGGFSDEPVLFGVNAFADIASAAPYLVDGGTMFVARGDYPQPVTVLDPMRIVGDGSDGVLGEDGTNLGGGITLAAGGIDAGQPMLLQGLAVRHLAGDGIRLVGDISHVRIEDVSSSRNMGNGLKVFTDNALAPSMTTDLVIVDSRFDNNGLPNPTVSQQVGGLVFDEDASLDGLSITGSTFNGNNSVGFSVNDIGAPGSLATIRNITIDDSEFSANNPANQGAGGGGIWLKTSGAGSLIEHVTIENSRFFDNGTGQVNGAPINRAINANGISVRVRPGTDLSGVRICGNTFGDTGVGGTQQAGIYVFDDQYDGDYAPVDVCADNDFGTLAISVSGHEQRAMRNSQPVVLVSGGTLVPAPESINTGYVGNARLARSYPSISAAMADPDLADGDTVFAPAGLYNETVVIPRAGVTLAGDGAATIIDGGARPASPTSGPPARPSLAGSGITIGVPRVTVRDVTVRNFTSIGHGEGGCIRAAGTVDGLSILGTTIDACRGGGGAVFVNGGNIDNVTIDDNTVSNFDGRGIVIWNGNKTDIRIRDNTIDDASHACCNSGIELQDGTASGVEITGNTISGSFDAGMNLVQVGGTHGPNLIADNTVSLAAAAGAVGNVGPRFGLQLTQPTGTGSDDEAAAGTVVVRDNSLTLLGTTDVRDVAGIAVIRRYVVAGQEDATRGVVVRGNSITGFAQGDATAGNDGFGIVVEGSGHVVDGNTILGSDTGVLLQQNANGPADVVDAFFSRGNAASTCVYVGSNSIDGNAVDGPSLSLSQPSGALLQARIRNQQTLVRYCSLQAAIDDPATLAGHELHLSAGEYAQSATVTKSLVISGPMATMAGDGQTGPGEAPGARDPAEEAVIAAPSGQALRLHADGIAVRGLSFTGLDGSPTGTAIASGSNFGGAANDVLIENNRFIGLDGHGIYTNGTGLLERWQVRDNLFDGIGQPGGSHSAINLWKMDDAAIASNTIRNVAFGGIQLNTGGDIAVLDNLVEHTGSNGINIGPQLDGVRVHGNTVVDTNSHTPGAEEAALTLYAGSSNVEITCNVFDEGSSGSHALSTSDDVAGSLGGGLRIFHNSIVGGVVHYIGGDLFVGSNWYGAPAAPAAGGSNGGAAFFAQALSASPIGEPACGDNTPTAIVAIGGSGQSATILTGFASVLQARVTDALGGAVPDTAVRFATPVSGASATATAAVGSTDYNGAVDTAVTANAIAGTYVVAAASNDGSIDIGSADFTLTNAKATGTIELVQATFPYTGSDHVLAARIVEEPGTSCAAIAPASIRTVGTHDITIGACVGTNVDAPAITLQATVTGQGSVSRLRDGALFDSVATALVDADTLDSDTLEVAPGVHPAPIVITRPITLRGAGALSMRKAGTTTSPTTIIDGGNLATNGILIGNGVQDVTVAGFEVRNIATHCVLTGTGVDGLVLRENLIHHCGQRGISVSGGSMLTGVTIDSNEVHTFGDRGIVVWDGVKRDITISNNFVHNTGGSGCCGIELQDGVATGAWILDNVVENVGDSGMSFIQLTSGSPSGRANIVRGNDITNTGRFGMEIKIPDGSGLDAPGDMGDGAIIVEGNVIDGSGPRALRDRAGIAVHRRSLGGPTYPYMDDATVGVILRNNSVSGFASSQMGYEGYGIVVEGFGSSIEGNTLGGNDIGLQLQQANPSAPPGDADQNAMGDWFGRGNAPRTCVGLGSNDLAANTIPSRSVPLGADLVGGVRNETSGTWFCSIQAAVNAASSGDVLRVRSGNYAENVNVTVSVSLLGPHAGVRGTDAARGTGEATIAASSGVALTLSAPDITVDGFTLRNANGHAVQRLAGQAADDLVVVNNRFVDIANGSGIFSEPGAVSGAGDGFRIADNLFRNITGSGAQNGRGVVLFKGTRNAQLVDNVFEDVQQHALQANGGTGTVTSLQVTGNRVGRTPSFTAGTAFVITGSSDVAFQRNLVVGTSGGLFLSDRTSNFTASCNLLQVTGNALSSADFFSGAVNSNVRIFDNALRGGNDLNNGMAQGLTVGSNWYDGAAAALNAAAVALQVADPLPLDPTNAGAFDVAGCGDNIAASIAVAGGDAQSALLNQAFAQPLRARVIDQLGGAVRGASVRFDAPASGASSTLAPITGTVQSTDYNGTVQATAMANGFAGGYPVRATWNATGIDLGLTNLALPQVVFDLNGPVGGVEVGDAVHYTGRLANADASLGERVFLRIDVDATVPLVASDVGMCAAVPGPACTPIAWQGDGDSLWFDLAAPSGFPIAAPFDTLLPFDVTFAKAGVYAAAVQVVGATSGTVYASDILSTEVIAQHAGVTLDISGPVTGVARDVPQLYHARLVNTEAAVADPVVVEFALTRSGGIQPGDVLVEYDAGGGNFLPITLFVEPAGLVADFGGAGFLVGEDYDSTTALRVTFTAAPYEYSVAATVKDASTNTDGVATYAADHLSTDVVDPQPDVTLDFTGPYATSTATAIGQARVGTVAYFRSRLANDGGDVADSVVSNVSLVASFGALADDDVAVEYWPSIGANGCATPGVPRQALVLAEDGVGGLVGVVGSPTGFGLSEGEVLEVCYAVTYHRAGTYSLAALIEDVGVDTDDRAVYAATNLSSVVAKGEATLMLGNLGPHTYDGSVHSATASVTPSGLDVILTHNGSDTLQPTAVGDYAVEATVDSDDWQGSANGVLRIAGTGGTVAFAPLSVTYNGSPQLTTATLVEEPSATCMLTWSSGSAPVNAGSYFVVAQCIGDNRSAVGTATFVIQPASASLTLDAPLVRAYNGAPQVVGVTVTPTLPVRVLYSGIGATQYPLTQVAPSAVGSYAVTADILDTNHVATTATGTLTITNDIAFALGGHATGAVTRDAPLYSYTDASVLNPGMPPSERVVAVLRVTRDGGIAGGDLGIDYRSSSNELGDCENDGSAWWCALTLVDGGGALDSVFGSATGFPLQTATSYFRTRYATGGRYQVQVSLRGVDTDTVFASAVASHDVAELVLDGAGATASTTGATVDSAVQLHNIGSAGLAAASPAPTNEPVRGRFRIVSDAGALSATDVSIHYLHGADYLALPLTVVSGGLEGDFGGAGFDAPAGYSGTSLFRSVFTRAANYTVITEIVGANSGSVFDRFEQQVAIGGSNGSITIDPASLTRVYTGVAQAASVITSPAGLVHVVTYDGGAALPVDAGSYAIVATITQPGYDGSASATLEIAKATSAVDFTGSTSVVYDGAAHALTVTLADEAANTDACSVQYAPDPSPASAPTAPGVYVVTATCDGINHRGVGIASMQIVETSNVAITLLDPPSMALIDTATAPYTDFLDYAGELRNSGGTTSQPVHYAITVTRIDDGNAPAGQAVAIEADDVKVCVYDPSGWAAQHPDHHDGCPQDYQILFASEGAADGRSAVHLRYPNLAANDIALPNTGPAAIAVPANFRFRKGEFHVQVDVVGSVDGRIYASTEGLTSVPDVSVAYSGATSGPAETALLSQTTLRNSGGPVEGNVIVRVSLADAGGAMLSAGDATFAYQLGGEYATLPWVDTTGGVLVTYFGPGSGFDLADGHDATTAGRGIFHRLGNYTLRYDVLDAATQSVVYASHTITPLQIAANNVAFQLADLVQVYDGTPRAVTVTPATAPHTVTYEALSGATCPATPSAGSSTPPTDAGDYCVWVAATGNHSGSASGLLTVLKATTAVTLLDTDATPGDGILQRVFDGTAQSVAATAAAPITGSIVVTYNGSTVPPTAVGSYAVTASVIDANHVGSASGTLVIGATATTLSMQADAHGVVVAAGSIVPKHSLSSATTQAGAPLSERVVARIAITRGGGALPGDLALDYRAATQEFAACVADAGTWWCPLTLADADADGVLDTTFGPATGFPYANATSHFRTRFNRGGSYGTTVRMVGVDTGAEYAIGAHHVDVAELALGASGATAGSTGLVLDSSVTLVNGGTAALGAALAASPNDENVIGRFRIERIGGPLPASDVEVAYLFGADYLPLSLVTDGDALEGNFGGVSGFPVPVGYAATSLFRSRFLQPGQYVVTTRIEGVNSDAMFDSVQQAVTITQSGASISIDPASLSRVYNGAAQPVSVSTSPFGLTHVVTYDGGASLPVNAGSYAVAAAITQSGYSGTANATLTIAKAMSAVTFSGATAVVYDGNAHTFAATLSSEAGNAAACDIAYAPSTPVAAGVYIATATCNGDNHIGSAVTTVTIAKAASVVAIDAADLAQTFGQTHAVDALATPAGSGNVEVRYDGSLAVPTQPGSYLVDATHIDPNYTGSANAILTVSEAADVSITLTDAPPMALVTPATAPYTDFVDYAGTLANAGSATAQPVHYAITVTRIDDGNAPAGQAAAIAIDDVKACLYDPSGWAAQDPDHHDGCEQDFQTLFASASSSDGRSAVLFRYPNLPVNDLPLPSTGGAAIPLPPTNFRFKRGEFHVRVDVVGSLDGHVYATTDGLTSVPDASVGYSGATSGPAEAALLSQTTLRNAGGPVDGNVIVRVTLADAGGAALLPGDATFAYQLGADYAALPWIETPADGSLVTYFGPASGFELPDGHDATTAARAVFHRIGNYTLRYDVLDAATRSVVFATQSVSPIQIAPNAVVFDLSDLHQVYDGTPRAVTVTPADVPHAVAYEARSGDTCPLAPTAASAVAPIGAGHYCVWVTATGSYSGGASGVLTIAKATTAVTLVDTDATPGDGIIERTFDGTAQAVAATASHAIAGSIDITYNGAAQAPTAVGSYVVSAVVVDANHVGAASGTLVIGSSGSSLVLAGSQVGAVVSPDSVAVAYTRSSATTAGNALGEPVIGRVAISRSGGADVADLAIDYLAAVQESPACVAGDGGFWCPLPLADADANGVLDGRFGPPAGFVFANASSQFRTRFARGGRYVTAIDIVGVNTGAVYATAARHVDVADLVLSGAGALAGDTGVALGSAVTLSNAGTAAIDDGTADAPNDEHVVGRFRIEHDTAALAIDDVTVAYLAGTTYQPIVLDAQGGGLDGSFGPGTGFPVAAGYSATSLFRSQFLLPGSYTVTTRIEGVDSGAVFSTLVQTVTVAASNATISIDPASLARTYDGSAVPVSVSTSPAGLAYTLTYAGSATPPTDAGSYAVVATVTTPGYDASADATLVIAKATAQVTLANLLHVYDGTPKAATATTVPAGLDVLIDYAGSPNAPSAIGSHAVHASVDDTNYTGESSGTLTILAASISALALDGDDTFTGIAGVALAGNLPGVRVVDANGDGVAGVGVLFEIGSGGGGGGGLVATDADGRAQVAGWTLGADAGLNTMSARVPGQAGLGVVDFEANASEEADIGVGIVGDMARAGEGDLVTFTIQVSNHGPSNAAAVNLGVALPAAFDAGTAQWLCTPTGAASCDSATGSGDVAVGLVLPLGDSVVVTLSANVAAGADPGPITIAAHVDLMSGTDTNTANDAGSAGLAVGLLPTALFSDGFEADIALPGKTAADASVPAFVPQWPQGIHPQPLAELRGDAGRVLVLDGLHVGDRRFVRLRGKAGGRDVAGAWLAVDEKTSFDMSRLVAVSRSMKSDGAATIPSPRGANPSGPTHLRVLRGHVRGR